MKKIIISIFVLLLVLWGVIFFIDYSRCSNFKEPIFVFSGVTADDGGSGTYYGLGYKVKIEKTVSAEYGPTLVKVELYMFEFVATIIGAYDSSILVEPEKGSNERKSSDKISIGIIRPTNGTNDFYVVGNKVKITYNGMIMESYPAQIIATKIELVK